MKKRGGGKCDERQREKLKAKSRTLNVGTMRGKGRELVDMMFVHDTSWKGSKARSIGARFKLYNQGVEKKRRE